MVVAAGVPLGINAWRNLLTDKRPYAERFADCEYKLVKRWVDAYRGPNLGATAKKAIDEARAACRAEVAP